MTDATLTGRSYKVSRKLGNKSCTRFYTLYLYYRIKCRIVNRTKNLKFKVNCTPILNNACSLSLNSNWLYCITVFTAHPFGFFSLKSNCYNRTETVWLNLWKWKKKAYILYNIHRFRIWLSFLFYFLVNLSGKSRNRWLA